MKRVFKIFRTLLLTVFLFMMGWMASAQKKEVSDRYLETSGIVVDENGGRVSEVKVVLTDLKAGRAIQTLFTKKNGKFVMELSIGREYSLAFSKEGYISKMIIINGIIKKPEELFYLYDYTLILSTTVVDDYGPEILGKPVVKVFFNASKKQFDFDAEYSESVKKELQGLSADQRKLLIEKLEDQRNFASNPNLKKKAEQEFKELVAKVEAENVEKLETNKSLVNKKVEPTEEDLKKAREKEEKEKIRLKEEEERLFTEEYKKKQAIYDEMKKQYEKENNEKAKVIKEENVVVISKPAEQVEKTTATDFIRNTPSAVLKRELITIHKMQEEIIGMERMVMLSSQRNEVKDQKIQERNENIGTKYNTKNPLTSLLDAVDEFDKKEKRKSNNNL